MHSRIAIDPSASVALVKHQRQLTPSEEWPLSGRPFKTASFRFWPVADELSRTAALDPVLPFASGSYAVFDPRLLDGIDNLPTTVTTFSGAFQRDIAVT